ncbi:MAG: hypothetical protein AVDCRST_MAG96-3498 [uncultured Segetibacter sp.]|uniref:Uncharacterized protein n=1 Tax=uncultured Segetibacter sp. TaxID=481133 RepID=A0A6J4TR56_9BACT|nr:MAG: hypothetical protein AVDCRST_MAG96-3498 [uncultured Segetibacter sp.]
MRGKWLPKGCFFTQRGVRREVRKEIMTENEISRSVVDAEFRADVIIDNKALWNLSLWRF